MQHHRTQSNDVILFLSPPLIFVCLHPSDQTYKLVSSFTSEKTMGPARTESSSRTHAPSAKHGKAKNQGGNDRSNGGGSHSQPGVQKIKSSIRQARRLLAKVLSTSPILSTGLWMQKKKEFDQQKHPPSSPYAPPRAENRITSLPMSG